MTIRYNSEHHLSLIFAYKGTVWKSVLPFCMINLALSIILFLLKKFHLTIGGIHIDLTFPRENGFSTLTTLLSFLVVARVSRSYTRMWQARSLLSSCLQNARAIAGQVASLSAFDEGKGAENWQDEIRLALIRMVCNMREILTSEGLTNFVVMGDFFESGSTSSTNDAAKKFSKLKSPHNAVDAVDGDNISAIMNGSSDHTKVTHTGEEGIETDTHETETDPFVLCTELQLLINNHGNDKFLGRQMEIQREMVLHKLVGHFIEDYYTLLQFVSTPVPFPTIQMTHTILFVWMMILPCILLHCVSKNLTNESNCSDGMCDDLSLCLDHGYDAAKMCVDNETQDYCSCKCDVSYGTGIVLIIASFFGTYGFWGLERVAEELDVPFGDDENDIEVDALSATIIKNINESLSYVYDRERRNKKKETSTLLFCHTKPHAITASGNLSNLNALTSGNFGRRDTCGSNKSGKKSPSMSVLADVDGDNNRNGSLRKSSVQFADLPDFASFE